MGLRLQHHICLRVRGVLSVLALVFVSLYAAGANAQSLEVDRTSAAFGNVRVGAPSATERVRVSNSGDATLTITQVTFSGANAGDFSLVSPVLPISIAPGAGSVPFELRCTPSSASALNAVGSFVSDAVTPSPMIALNCQGSNRELVVNPVSLTFDQARVGEATAPRTITIRNQGSSVRTISSIGFVGPGFVFSTPPPALPFALSPGSVLNLQVRFAPTASFDYASFLIVEHDAPEDRIQINLSGAGRIARSDISPVTVDFGEVLLAEAPPEQVVTIRNVGTADFLVTGLVFADPASWTIQDPPALPFLLQPAPAGPTGNGDELALRVSATPQSIGEVLTTLRVTTDIPGQDPTVIALSAIGVAPELGLSSTAIDFELQDVQAIEPKLGSVTLFNTGAFDLSISSMTLEDSDGNPYTEELFSLVDPSPRVIAVGESSVVEATYMPLLEGNSDEAVLRIQSDGFTQNDVRVVLIGQGSDRHIEVSPTELMYPSLYRFTADPVFQDVTIANTGDAQLALSMVIPDGDNADSFLVPDSPMTVGAGQSSVVRVGFRPAVAGPNPIRAELLIVNDDDERPMVRVDLEGSSMLPEIEVTPDAIDFGRPGLQASATIPEDMAQVVVTNENPTRAFTIREIGFASDGGEVYENVFRPLGLEANTRLEPFQSVQFDVAVVADTPGLYQGKLQVFIDADELPTAEVAIVAGVEEVRVRGGKGCQSSSGVPVSAAIFGLLIFIGSVVRKRSIAALLSALVLFFGSASQAQTSRNLDADPFRAKPGIRSSWIGLQSPQIGDSTSYNLGGQLLTSLNPVSMHSSVDDSKYAPVSFRVGSLLMGSYALSFAELGLSLPVYGQLGQDPTFGNVDSAQGFGLGELAAQAKVSFFELNDYALGMSLGIRFPALTQDDFAGSDNVTLETTMLGQHRRGDFDIGVNLGARFREEATLAGASQGSEIVYGFGGAYDWNRHWASQVELQGAIGWLGRDNISTSPAEILVGSVYRSLNGWLLRGAFGRGVIQGIGASDFRAVLTLSISVGDHSADDERWVEGFDYACQRGDEAACETATSKDTPSAGLHVESP